MPSSYLSAPGRAARPAPTPRWRTGSWRWLARSWRPSGGCAEGWWRRSCRSDLRSCWRSNCPRCLETLWATLGRAYRPLYCRTGRGSGQKGNTADVGRVNALKFSRNGALAVISFCMLTFLRWEVTFCWRAWLIYITANNVWDKPHPLPI